jgi:hypothetical protein
MALDSCSLQSSRDQIGSSAVSRFEVENRNHGIENFLTSEPKIVHAPARPSNDDSQGWQRFLAAYQSGKWELCDDDKEIGPIQHSPSADLTIVHDAQGVPMDNIGKQFSIHFII